MAEDLSDIDPDRGERFSSGEEGYEFSQCDACEHFNGQARCDAFDDRTIPMAILKNDFDHRQNHPDDNGRTWTPERDEDVHPYEKWEGAHA